jgi:hypothetical protein
MIIKKLISPQGSTQCRACYSENLTSVLDLGSQPLPSEYGSTATDVLDTFPLHLRICRNCGLGQLGEFVLPERIFHKTYPYLSSASATWVEHARNYALDMKKELQVDNNNLVLELASNDGYLLSEFKKLGVKILGVEPAENVASIAIKSGVPTIIEFFGVDIAKNILTAYGYPRLIVANNVFAHIPDMHDFIEGISILSNDKTVITIENPSFTELLKNTLFDTIYHEHYSYLTAHSVLHIAKAHGLKLFRVEQLPTHGGSNRYWLSKTREVELSVQTILDQELKLGLFEPLNWNEFAARAESSISGLRNWFIERRNAGDVVVGYGAAHKGNTFLNAVGPESKNLVYVVDASKEKQGKFLPGSQVQVYSPDMLLKANPTDVLILPWNIAPEIADRIRRVSHNVRIWVAHPKMRQLKI